jgi:hypothetical protein
MTGFRGASARERLRETVVETVLGAGLECMTHDLSFRVEPVVQVTARMIALSF